MTTTANRHRPHTGWDARPMTRAERLDLLVGRTRLIASTSPDPQLGALVAELAAELRSLARTVAPEA